MILVELTAATNLNGDLRTFYLSADGDFVTSPTDTPPNVSFDQRLLEPGSIGLHAYADGKVTGGATALEVGEITIANMDGELDGWLDYSFDGRPIAIRTGPADGAYPAAFSTVFAGTMESISTASSDELTIAIRDQQYVLRVPALTALYGGTNVLPAGLDGTVDDLLGKPIPRAFGTVFNVSPPCVNTSKLVYQVNAGAVAAISAVYDGGGPLTFVADYATSADMLAASLTTGYVTCLAEGYFRLGAAQAATITCDVVQGASPSDRTTAQVLRKLALLSPSVTAGQVAGADVTALDAAFPGQVGIWLIDTSTTVQGAMDQIAASINAWYAFDAVGQLRMGVLTEPGGAPKLLVREDMVLVEGFTRSPARDGGIPAWRMSVSYAKNWTTQTSGLIGAATTARRAFVELATRTAIASDPTVQTKYLLAADVELDGLLAFYADGLAEANRQLLLQKSRRDVFEVPISADELVGTSLFYMDVVSLSINRYGLANGRLFRLIGMRLALADNTIVLQLWG